MIERIGIFGGTFNPVHNGHVGVAVDIQKQLHLSRILWVPSYLPPHKNDGVPAASHRVAMVRLATMHHPGFYVSDIELKRGGISYSIDTIEHLRLSFPDALFYFLIGIDSFLDIHTWREWEKLLAECCMIILARPGYSFADLKRLNFLEVYGEQLSRFDDDASNHLFISTGARNLLLYKVKPHAISSTAIREICRSHGSTKYLLPDSVETYIIANNLYE